MTPDDLKQWQRRLGLSNRAAAEALTTKLRTYEDWRRGVATPPACLWLACLAIEHGLHTRD